MRAVYEIYSALTDVVVDHVTLDVYGDPHEFTIRYEAVDAAGHEPSAYTARFIGYEGGIATVPFEVVEAVAALININPVMRPDRVESLQRNLRTMLLATGYLEDKGGSVNPVSPD
jgi:hypothetical protein